ncbi:MAG: signal recognition particle-docking protein FtsY [Clostridia bacterium]|nr:signal recognition particle-docking protein FtsY [Clostridia bacterium]
MFFSKLKENLKKTKEAFDIKLDNIFGQNKDYEQIIDEIEEVLILSDVGVNTSAKICNNLRKSIKSEKDRSSENLKKLLKDQMVEILDRAKANSTNYENYDRAKQIILVVGVNGVGKTTSIGKLANLYRMQGKRVLLAAADTFRAGAIDQLEIWANRSDSDICLGKPMEDPASVVYEAVKKFKEEDYDILICDTAGRLHNKKNLMDELEKIKRIIDKNISNVKEEVFIVLDSTTGQNAILQVKNFFERTQVSGIILTKLDSTAKGGVVLSIVDELNIPIRYIGTGEKMEDISEFSSVDFVDSII